LDSSKPDEDANSPHQAVPATEEALKTEAASLQDLRADEPAIAAAQQPSVGAASLSKEAPPLMPQAAALPPDNCEPETTDYLTRMEAENALAAGNKATQPVEVRSIAAPDSQWTKAAGQTAPAVSKEPATVSATSSASGQAVPMFKRTINLKNARVGERYDATIVIDGLKEIRLEDDAATGLMVDAAGHVTGTPQKSGDYLLRIRGLINGSRCEVSVNLAVIPDPKSLWTSKPSDGDALYWKEEQAFGYSVGDLLCVAASKRGRSHARDGTFRDDDFGLFSGVSGGWQIAVVADGAGSAKYSRYGSALAVKTVLCELPDLLEQLVSPQLEVLIDLHLQGNLEAGRQIKARLLYRSLAAVAFNAAKAIEEEALAKNERAAAYSTTLIIGVVRKVRDKWFIAGFAIGDGGMAVFDVTDRSLRTMSLPDSGEYAGQTRFLSKSEFASYEDVERRLFFDVRSQFTAIALMTDGITDPKFPTDHAFADPSQWMTFWEQDLCPAVSFSRTNLELKSQFMNWMDFWSPGNHDDRTLAILVP